VTTPTTGPAETAVESISDSIGGVQSVIAGLTSGLVWTPTLFWSIGAIIVLLVLSGAFSGSETALTAYLLMVTTFQKSPRLAFGLSLGWCPRTPL